MQSVLSYLQKLPYSTRLRILWSTVVLAGLVLLVLWFFSLQKEVENLNNQSSLITSGNALGAQKTSSGLVEVERVELTETSLRILFNVNNQSNDILNFSSAENIELVINGQVIKPMRVLDRQNKAFVSKILSETRNFGVLVFQPMETSDATLTFDDLYYEKRSETLLKETLELDLEELTSKQELRK